MSKSGSIDWLCFPRPDSAPVFGKLLDDEGGHFSISSSAPKTFEQHYIPNTNILTSTITDEDGSQYRITDFCPRFYQHGRTYRPTSLFRIVEPIKGSPQIKVSCRPINGWEREYAKPIRGNSHIRWEIRDESLRLITNMPMTYLWEETPFLLKEKIYFGLTWGFGIEEDLPAMAERMLGQTAEYWKRWVKHCSVPTLYQKETIRSALALKLHCFEDTGAILAALTTSLPEEFGHTRNWDYRFCWLRDSYFTLTAFHALGQFEEMEGFIRYFLGIAEQYLDAHERLRPVYRLDQSLPLPETSHINWHGFQGSRPVRSDNQAAEHVQNDVYGEMVLVLSPIFFDERFQHLRTREHERLLENLGRLCMRNISEPDAGLWEIRDGWQEHTFSNLMCWAGLERIHRIRKQGYLKNIQFNVEDALLAAEKAVLSALKEGSIRNGPQDESYDSALLLLSVLRFPTDKINLETTMKIKKELSLGFDEKNNGYLYRYLRKDDFGKPQSAFMICSFWLVQSLARVGQMDEARHIMKNLMPAANEVGLFAEHFHPEKLLQTGNFPQAYSHVGLINAAFSISKGWDEVL